MQNELTEPDWYMMLLLEQAEKDPAYRRELNKAVAGGRITMQQVESAAKRLKKAKGIAVQLPARADAGNTQHDLWPCDARERP
jgi:hypothetical protein